MKKIILTENQLHLLFTFSLGCEYCDALYKKYNKNKYFDVFDLSPRELIHIETTTRMHGIAEQYFPKLMRNVGVLKH